MKTPKTPEEILKSHGWYDPNVSAGNYRIPMPYVLSFMEEYASQFRKPEKKSIDERKNDFVSEVEEIGVTCASGINLIEFIDYWTEHGPNDRKMRFEKQTSFDIKKRLARWKRNQKPTYGQSTKPSTDEAVMGFISGQGA